MMLGRYITGVERLSVPLTNDRYQITLDGSNISDNYSSLERRLNAHGEICVELDWYAGLALYPVSLVVAHTFKPTKVPVQYWERLSVEFFDGNRENFDAANLVWRFPKGLGSEDYHGFGFIPMCSRYLISREGAVFDLQRKRFLKAGYSNGYFRFTLITDLGEQRSFFRHRLLGLVFLDYPTDADTLQINHINSVKGDDFVENLEWVTGAENVRHAVETGLKGSIKPVLVENVLDGTVRLFNTFRACCKTFGLGKSAFSKALSQAPWVFEKWPLRFSYQKEEDRTRTDIRATKVLVRNLRDGTIVEYDRVVDCARALGLPRLTVQSRLMAKFDKVYPDGLQIRRAKDVTSWYQPEDVEAAIAKAGLVTPCEVRDCATAEVTRYESQRDLCKQLKLCEAAGHNWLSSDGRRVFKAFDSRLIQVRRCSVLEDWYVPENPQAEYDSVSLEKRIIVRDVRTGTEVVYDSGVQCAAAHQILTTTLNYRLSVRGQRLFDGRYQFKYATDELPFKQIDYVPSPREGRSKLP